MKRVPLFLVCLILLSTCSLYQYQGNVIYIEHKDAIMPVWIRGNINSGIFIVYLHGGPGGTSAIDIQNGYFDEIEKDYAVVFYDQRSSGNSQGNSFKELLTLDQFVEDLDVVTSYVDQKFHPNKKILLGHSWGGTLGTAYLLNNTYRAKYNGWIEVDGGHNISDTAFELSKSFILSHTTSEEIIKYYEDLYSWRDTDVILTHSSYVKEVGGYFYNKDIESTVVGLDQILFSGTNFISLLAQNEFVIRNMDIWHYDFTDRLTEIDIPTLILWGKYDGILPLELGIEAADTMELDNESFYIFQESGHSPHYEETELFNDKVISFIENNIK